MINKEDSRIITFQLGDMVFEYDVWKNTMVNTGRLTREMVEELSFSDEERAALYEAGKREIVFDRDCPEVTPEQALKFRRVNPRLQKLGERA